MVVVQILKRFRQLLRFAEQIALCIRHHASHSGSEISSRKIKCTDLWIVQFECSGDELYCPKSVGPAGKRPEAEESWNYFGFLTDVVRIGKSDPDGAPKGCPSVHV